MMTSQHAHVIFVAVFLSLNQSRAVKTHFNYLVSVECLDFLVHPAIIEK